jgi:starch synthase (maltosyl-transferring)
MNDAPPEIADFPLPAEAQRRVIVQNLSPAVEGGRFAAKGTLGEAVVVEADVFTDGHDAVVCDVLYRVKSESAWQRHSMEPLGNDRWRGSFVPGQLGAMLYTVAAWVDPLAT